jgi:hypothetical protein
MMSDEAQKAREIKKKHESEWLSIRGVTAVGVGMAGGKTAIIVSVESGPEAFHTSIPSRVEDIPVVIKQSGEIKAHEQTGECHGEYNRENPAGSG